MNFTISGKHGAAWSLGFLVSFAGCGGAAQQPVAMMAPEMPGLEPAPADVTVVAEVPDALSAIGADIDTVVAGRFDNGRMWTFEYPPIDYFAEEYGFVPDEEWFASARLGALRLPGCTASFVSPNGLVMTNHHCARGSITGVSRDGEDLLVNGFYAPTLAEERPIPDYYADQMIAIEDVTERIHSRLDESSPTPMTAQIQVATNNVAAAIREAHGGDEAGIFTQVVSLWNGAKYSAYVFKRYTDVRMVAAPELQIGFFGGDPDNFTYPRYNLDFSFYRIYDDEGDPLQTDNFFAWSEEGVAQGDAIFVIGNPGSTTRLQTATQLAFRRDFREGVIFHLLGSRARAYQRFMSHHPEEAAALGDMRNRIFGLLNSEKAYRGHWMGLNDPVVMARRMDSDRRLREHVMGDPELRDQYGDVFERMDDIQRRKREWGPHYQAFLGITSGTFSSPATRRAILAYHYMDGQANGAPAEELEALAEQYDRITDLPFDLQKMLLDLRLNDFARYLGEGHPAVRMVVMEDPIEVAARRLLYSCALTNGEVPAIAEVSSNDPMVQWVASFYGEYEDYQDAWQELSAEEAAVELELGRAHFDVYGTSMPPDATFSLRIADGVVQSYEYNGTVAPVYTTFFGMYDHYYSYGAGTEWDLPARWLSPPASFDMSTPLNFVATSDIIGGNSGSPVINHELEVVGLVFDGNIESLPGDYIFMPDRNRTVAVDVRGILEALDEIYDADRIVYELTRGVLVPSEAAADRMMAR